MFESENKNIIRKAKLRRPELMPSDEAELQPADETRLRDMPAVEYEFPTKAVEEVNELTVESVSPSDDATKKEENIITAGKERLLLRPTRIGLKPGESEPVPGEDGSFESDTELTETFRSERANEDVEEMPAETDDAEVRVEAEAVNAEMEVTAELAEEEIVSKEASAAEFGVISERQPQLKNIIEISRTKAEMKTELPRTEKVEKTFYTPDIPLRFSTFDEALGSCQELHPLPEELLIDQTDMQRTWLLSQLKKARTESEIEALAYSLEYKDLSILFPVLSTLKKREDVNQVQNLIRLRASHFLYVCGWLTLQFSYPRSTVARVLADLCMILDDISFLREELSSSDQEQVKECKVPDLGPDRILWNDIEMISEISLPNSRRFVSDIANELYKSNIEEDIFLKRYAIYPNLALGKAILEKFEEIASGMDTNPMMSNAFLDRFRRDQ